MNKELKTSNKIQQSTDEAIQTAPAETENTTLYHAENMQTATKYSSTQPTNKPSPACHHKLHEFYDSGEETLRENAVKDEHKFKQCNRMRDSSLLRSHTPFISVCDYDEQFVSSHCSDNYEQQETVIDAAASTKVSQVSNLPMKGKSK